MTKTCILLNGPAVSGKGVAAEHLYRADEDLNATILSCKDHLHTLVQEMFIITPEAYWEIYCDRELKEAPSERFQVRLSPSEYHYLRYVVGIKGLAKECVTKLSLREALIYVSECVIKTRFGGDYFGKTRALKVLQSEANLIIDDSCAFVEELPPLINAAGQENILLIRIHRKGYTFEGDSRSYIPDGVITNTVDVVNEEGKEGDYLNKIHRIVEEFHSKRKII